MSINTQPSGEGFDPPLPPISSPYLLVINVPLYRDADGALSADPLWFKDLAEHLSYLDDFTLACPVLSGRPGALSTPLKSDARFARVKIVPLPAPASLVSAMSLLPLTAWRLFRAVRQAEVIHAGVAGWPIPYGWIVAPMAKVVRRKLVIIVESAPWRLNARAQHGLKARIMSWVYERLGRWTLRRSDLAIFTQEEYRQSFLRTEPERGHVIHASWIDRDIIVSDAAAEAIWDQKNVRDTGRLRLLFAGRLEPQKGIAVLLDAIRVLAGRNVPLTLDILGAGALAEQCRVAGEELSASTRVNLLGTVAYGAALFDLLKRYHAVVLPSISDEQPRIVYDAYAQAVPALASRTAGLRDCIHENETGWLVDPNSVQELVGVIERAVNNREELRRMGMAGLNVARSMTHEHMHRKRQSLLLQLTRPARH